MYTDNELLFPVYVVQVLRDMRGDAWRDLVDRVMSLPETHPEALAFMLAMIHLNGCMECETDSYRAMRGCAMCATQTLHRYKGPDEELLDAYAQALADMQAYLGKQAAIKVA
jgi:hypothetical protein